MLAAASPSPTTPRRPSSFALIDWGKERRVFFQLSTQITILQSPHKYTVWNKPTYILQILQIHKHFIILKCFCKEIESSMKNVSYN